MATAIGTTRESEGGGDPGEIQLYERWKKLYPLRVIGPFQLARHVALVLLLIVFYASPWLTWDGHPAVLFDVPARKFVFLWATFWPQELVLLSWILIISAFALFFFTVVAGRIWCGWACPQTVWTLCYVWIEHVVEGNRNQRLRLDSRPWNAERITKKAVKWSLWALLALSISVTFVGYFVPIRELLPKIVAQGLVPWERFWLLFPAGLSFLFSGVLREQVCIHMCPYARFQSVMFDRDTLIISYDEDRGEPRGSRNRNADPAALELGTCIDCKLCVHVCPTGIDIRDGLQQECIGCAACIDVCNDVMGKMGYAPNLVRYSSLHQDRHEEKAAGRPRLVGYGAVLVAMLLAFTYAVSHRVPLEIDIIRDRARLYREHWDGSVENVYTLKIMNREQTARTYRIRAGGEVPVVLATGSGTDTITVEAGTQASLPVRLRTGPEVQSAPNTGVTFTLDTTDEPHFSVTGKSRFLRPEAPPNGRG
jgi:cytochrome c oxidase accessory protein FixG